MRNSFVDRLLELAKKDNNIMLLTGDLGFGVLEKFATEIPNQYLNCGVAEQNMTAIASGLALEGKVPFTYSIGNFPTLRCLEHIRNDVAYHDLPVKIVCIGGGFSYGQLGMSHHATEDLSIMRSIPGITVISPADAGETVKAVLAAVHHNESVYIRLTGGGNNPIVYEDDYEYEIGKGNILREGNDITIIAVGTMVYNALKASELLHEKGISTKVINMHTIKPLDKNIITNASENTKLIVTVEEQCLSGGFGSAVLELLSDAGLSIPVKRLGLQEKYYFQNGGREYLLDQSGLATQDINRAVEEI